MGEERPFSDLGKVSFPAEFRTATLAFIVHPEDWMPALVLIPFAAFACCVLGQFYLMRQVRSILANKHPDVWRELSSKSFFIDNAVFSFIWKKRDRGLDDLELTAVAVRMRKLQVAAIGIWLVYMVALFTTLGSSTPR